MGSTVLFDDSWEFRKLPLDSSLAGALADPACWRSVELPHDWLIQDTRNLYETAEGWYRKSFTITADLETQLVFLRFDGVYMDSTVFINGHEAFEWKYGYSTFELDATSFLVPGKNQVVVRTRHQCPNSRWYSGAGIYRHVWLKTKPRTHLASDGIYIAPRETEGGWEVRIGCEINVAPSFPGCTGLELRHILFDPRGKEVGKVSRTWNAQAGLSQIQDTMAIADPELWDVDDPRLYSLGTQLVRDGHVWDEESQDFGFRILEFDPDQGFFLNGRHLKLQGVCQHHDLGCLGAAFNLTALRRQFTILKSMGVNAIRTAHNMPAPEFMDLADRMGILVVSESFDMWEKPKNPYDYARFFPQWYKKDVASWVRRDRNHPSLMMWCIGNEIHDTHASSRGLELTRLLMDEVALHDPLGNAPVTIGSNYMPWEGAQNCADLVKLAGYNYAEKYYADHHQKHPDWIIYGSETSSIVQSRGIYHFPASQSMLADDDEQCSSLGNSATSWGAKSMESCICDDRDTPFSLGQFLWSGFDYIGEPTPYHTKNSYFGQIDTAGFPKDSFYVWQAAWTDWQRAPMVHIFPYWDFNEGQLIDVRVCSNAPRVELFQDGISLGSFDMDHQKGRKLLGSWQIPYRPGVLEARAYGPEGTVIATHRVESFGDAARIVLYPDRLTLEADGRDLVFVQVSAVDARGREVSNATNRVQVKVSGAASLAGLDNGDSTDFDPYQGSSKRLFSGKLLAVIASGLEPGPIRVEASSPGLETAVIELASLPAPGMSGQCGGSQVRSGGDTGIEAAPVEIPVRKIEIVCPAGNRLDQERPELEVEARILPGNATWQDLEWRVCNDAGIDSNLARVTVLPESRGHRARVIALGDGTFRLRCMSRNGHENIRLISQMEFHVSGMGQATLDPYGFVSGGLWTRTNADLGNGNERGVATPRDGESRVCFDGVDFGDWGADTITLPLFALDSEAFPVEIWQGMPGDEGSELLLGATYQKPSQWNTYQAVTWKLNHRLKGVCSLCFVFRRKVHLKGFCFERIQKAWDTLGARDNSRIYGDSFTLAQGAILDIGNNVSLEYPGLDFGDQGCRSVTIRGRSSLEKNTIHLRFEGPEGECKRIAEFAGSPDWSEQTFVLEPVRGENKLTLVFLPGSRLDLEWLRFS